MNAENADQKYSFKSFLIRVFCVYLRLNLPDQ